MFDAVVTGSRQRHLRAHPDAARRRPPRAGQQGWTSAIVCACGSSGRMSRAASSTSPASSRADVAMPGFEPSPLAPRRTPEEEARSRSGLGSVISRESHQRLLNPDGSFNVRRSGLRFLESLAPYHQALSMSWTRFFSLVALCYLALNLLFALAYVACGPDALTGPGSAMLGGPFGQAFFFSIQTFATIGYGQIGPNGLAANLVVTIEALVGLMYQALATGLLFARFSRPTASILFSRHAVVAPSACAAGLMFRLLHRPRTELIEPRRGVSSRRSSTTSAAGRFGVWPPAGANKVTFFRLVTVVHPIDEPIRRGQDGGTGAHAAKSWSCCQAPTRRGAYGARAHVVPRVRYRVNARFQSMFHLLRRTAGRCRYHAPGRDRARLS